MMKTRGLLLGAALILAGGFSVLAADDTPAATAIKKLADDAGKKDWADLTKAGSEVAKKHELIDVMNTLKLRKEDAKIAGVGVGAKPGAITPDGIEAKIHLISKNPMKAEVLDKQQADLIRMAEITAAIAATAAHQCPVEKPDGAKTPKKWKDWSKEMYESSQDLINALKAKNVKQVQASASKLSGTCTDCHAVFRD